jgi:hypothetical protein
VSNPAVVAAVISLGGVIVSAGLAWFTAQNTVRLEQAKRQSELALKISELVSAPDKGQRVAAMRRYAVAVVKIVQPVDHSERGMVYFIPMNSRITVGRADENDIVLKDEQNFLSRWHCGFIADQKRVWIDDYKSTNGTRLRGIEITEPQELKNDDEIEIGPYRLHFRIIKENTILSQ